MNKIKTKCFIHVVNTIKFSVNNISKKYNFKITLMGDKGYKFKGKNRIINIKKK